MDRAVVVNDDELDLVRPDDEYGLLQSLNSACSGVIGTRLNRFVLFRRRQFSFDFGIGRASTKPTGTCVSTRTFPSARIDRFWTMSGTSLPSIA